MRSMLKEYRIESILGKGGFGITYLATDTKLHHKVAIKELFQDNLMVRVRGHTVLPQSTAQNTDFNYALKSFIEEARTLAKFKHPNIVGIIRIIEENGTAYMVMPYMNGQSIEDLLKRQPARWNAKDLYQFAVPLLAGLEEVHQANVLHRDIKPGNVFLTDEKQQPVLIDFGAARQAIGSRTQQVTSIVTPGYAPPEQYETDSEDQGPWSDLYGVAALFYRLVTGEIPPDALRRQRSLYRDKRDLYQNLTDRQMSGFEPQTLAAIDRALQVDERKRPQTVEEFRRQLIPEGILAAEPSSVRVITTPRRRSSLQVVLACLLVFLTFAAAFLVAYAVFPEQFQSLFAKSSSAVPPPTIKRISVTVMWEGKSFAVPPSYLALKSSGGIERVPGAVDALQVRFESGTPQPLELELRIPGFHNVSQTLPGSESDSQVLFDRLVREEGVVNVSFLEELRENREVTQNLAFVPLGYGDPFTDELNDYTPGETDPSHEVNTLLILSRNTITIPTGKYKIHLESTCKAPFDKIDLLTTSISTLRPTAIEIPVLPIGIYNGRTTWTTSVPDPGSNQDLVDEDGETFWFFVNLAASHDSNPPRLIQMYADKGNPNKSFFLPSEITAAIYDATNNRWQLTADPARYRQRSLPSELHYYTTIEFFLQPRPSGGDFEELSFDASMPDQPRHSKPKIRDFNFGPIPLVSGKRIRTLDELHNRYQTVPPHFMGGIRAGVYEVR